MSVALSFVSPPPGFDPLKEFTLNAIASAPGLYALVAAASQNIRVYVVDASVYLPDYLPVLSDEQVAALQLNAPEDALVLVVANPAKTGTTVNLMAPIVVNSLTGASAQFILDGQDWPLQAELGAARAA
jgi:flagellar assembly factor FliW